MATINHPCGCVTIDTCLMHDYELQKSVKEFMEELSEIRQLDDEAKRLREAKDSAYTERNKLVALLSSMYPSHLCVHDPNDTAWEDDWRTIVCIHSPAGQVTWHIHDSEIHMFTNLAFSESHWDGHTVEEKYGRVAELRRRAGEGKR